MKALAGRAEHVPVPAARRERPGALAPERGFLFFHQLGDGSADFRAYALAGHGRKGFEIDTVEKLAMERELQLLVFRSGAFFREEPVNPPGFARS